MKKIVTTLLAAMVLTVTMSTTAFASQSKGEENFDVITYLQTQHGNIVSAEKYWDFINTGIITYTYADGYQVIKRYAQRPHETWVVKDKYLLSRIDFCDGLIDKDGNGIDDRDVVSNNLGLYDLNCNGIIDGSPLGPDMAVTEKEYAVIDKCEHGVVDGYHICHADSCAWQREIDSHYVCY